MAALLLTGCAHYELVWVRTESEPSEEGFKMDAYKCRRDARVTGVVKRGIFTQTVSDTDDGLYDECMGAKGWAKPVREVTARK